MFHISIFHRLCSQISSDKNISTKTDPQSSLTKMANPLPVSKLGRHRFSFAKSINLDAFPVRVRRQDSTIENVMLMDEMVAFLDKEMPNAVDNYMAYPQTFQYNQEALKQIQGFPEEARTRFSRPAQSGPRDNEQILKEEWRKRAQGDSSEAKTFRALQTLFQVSFCLGSQWRGFSVPLTPEERMLAEARVYKRQYKRISWT